MIRFSADRQQINLFFAGVKMSAQTAVSELFPVESPDATLALHPAIVKVVRHLSGQMIDAYLHGIGVNPDVTVPRFDGAVRANMRGLLEWIGQLDNRVLGVMGADAERVLEMADNLGQESIRAVASDHADFAAQENAIARTVWLYLHEPDSFRRAEEIRYADNYRLGRMWDGFVGLRGASVSEVPDHRREFAERIKVWFRSSQVKVEVYERVRVGLKGGETRLVQVVVYREGLPDSVLEFENGDLTRRHLRPVYEFSLTYDADTGVIEVVAQDRASREEMAHAFTDTLLRQKISGKRIPLREYDLRPLMSIHPFPTDPEDGIRAVEVISLSLQPLIDGAEMITFDADRKTGRSLYERLFEWFREHNPLTNGFRIQKVILAVQFHSDGGIGRGKVVPVKLSLPNGCSLKNKTDKERLVCEKYLPLWGLVREV